MIIVNYHPLKSTATANHYDTSKHDAISVLERQMSFRDMIGFCKGNILKYKLRNGEKTGTDDLLKIFTYEKYIELLSSWNNQDDIIADVLKIRVNGCNPFVYCIHEAGTDPKLDTNRIYTDCYIGHTEDSLEASRITEDWHSNF